MNLILFGAPGTGKGTQSSYLISHFQLRHISTGNLFRSAVKERSALGLEAASYMDQGKLVPDSVVIGLIKEVLLKKSSKRDFIFDGFPRTLAQAEALDELLSQMDLKLNRVLHLQVSKSVLLERLVGRRVSEKSGHVYHIQFSPPTIEGICDKTGEKLVHRNDDKEDVVQTRLQAYLDQTAPLISYYKDKNLLTEIDGQGSPEEVSSRIKDSLMQEV